MSIDTRNTRKKNKLVWRQKTTKGRRDTKICYPRTVDFFKKIRKIFFIFRHYNDGYAMKSREKET